MHISGDLSLKINGFKTFTRINLVPKSGKLQLHFKECQLKLGNLNLQLYGGLGAWIANHFTGGAQESIKKALQQEVSHF